MLCLAVLYYPVVPGLGSCKTEEWGGCRCNYQWGNCSVAACQPQPTVCSSQADCASCSQATGCGWCDSSTFSGCVQDKPALQSGCGALQGAWVDAGSGTCGAQTGTPCTQGFSNCTACEAASQGCAWCQESQSNDPSRGTCLGKTAGLAPACTAFSGYPINGGACPVA
jgi:hypothetical protein